MTGPDPDYKILIEPIDNNDFIYSYTGSDPGSPPDEHHQ
jgi:hypothetical protein